MRRELTVFRSLYAVLLAGLLLFLFAAGSFAKADSKKQFVCTQGRQFVLQGKPYLIRGIAMGNSVWSNPLTPPLGDHSEKSFRELADLGFNSVRFYLNYALFESDAAPYEYRQEGFDWIDRNLAWAKAHGIRLILNMHYPQGGYQSQGNGDLLWTVRENQERLKALWGKIAEYYADEEWIIGYGLVNEPIPIGKTSSRDGLRVWQNLAQEITDEIRRYDRNHVIFVEKVIGVKAYGGGEIDWSLPFADQFVTVKDTNTAYEFHTYDPFYYTHQGFDWAGTEGMSSGYPGDDFHVTGVEWLSCKDANHARPGAFGWQAIESGLVSVSDPKANAVALCFRAAGIGRDGCVRADDLVLDVYGKDGKLLRSVPCETAETHGNFTFWAQNGEGSGKQDPSAGFDDRQSICIRGTTGDANMTCICLAHAEGQKYKVRGQIQVEKASSGATITLRVDAYHAQAVSEGSRDLLWQSVADARAMSERLKCPLYCGEFGAGIHCFEENRGGTLWVADCISFLENAGISLNYHSFYDGSFGLYYDKYNNRVRNDALAQVFASCFGEAGTP